MSSSFQTTSMCLAQTTAGTSVCNWHSLQALVSQERLQFRKTSLYVKGHIKHMLKFEHLLKALSSITPKVKPHFSIT